MTPQIVALVAAALTTAVEEDPDTCPSCGGDILGEPFDHCGQPDAHADEED